MTSAEGHDETPALHRARLAFPLVLAIVTAVAFCGVLRADFFLLDDPGFLSKNPWVEQGLTWDGMKWAWTTNFLDYWHPLTWISMMIDAQIAGGLRPWMFHLTNLLLHVADAELLFLLLVRGTGAYWRSALVATLFALHPVNVEAVAWVSARKDVLATFFQLLSILGWIEYARRPSWIRWFLSFLAFGCSLACKPMGVTIPMLLLVLDAWPLRRFAGIRGGASALRVGRLAVEKVPFFCASIASSVATYRSLLQKGAVANTGSWSLPARLASVPVNYVRYLGALVFPYRLSTFYPLVREPAWLVLGATLFLLAFTTIAVIAVRRRPWLLAGWLWFLGVLFPVAGLIQQGPQSRADRFVYLPAVGWFLLLSWGAAELTEGRALRRAMPGLALLVAGSLGVRTSIQVQRWRDSVTLLRSSLDSVGEDGWLEGNLGLALIKRGKVEEGVAHFRRAYLLTPDQVPTDLETADVFLHTGHSADAVAVLEHVEAIAPDTPSLDLRLGLAYEAVGRRSDALRAIERELERDPGSVSARQALARIVAGPQPSPP